MADKNQSDIHTQEEMKNRHIIRTMFWKKLLSIYQSKHHGLFSNISPSKDSWISASSGISGVMYNFVITQKYARVELLLQRPEREENKFIFDQLLLNKQEIEGKFGAILVWERLDEKKACRIKYQLDGVNVFNEEEWTEIINFMIEHMPKLHLAVKDTLHKTRAELGYKVQDNEE